MKNYDVTLWFHSSVIINVDADNEEGALKEARKLMDADRRQATFILSRKCDNYCEQIINGLQENSKPDVEEIDEY